MQNKENLSTLNDYETQEDIETKVFWCNECSVPIIKRINDVSKNICTLCGSKTDYLSTDLRPVFPEERLLYEILTEQPLALIDKCFWANNSRYFVDGIGTALPVKKFENADIPYLRNKIQELSSLNHYEYFNQAVDNFIHANQDHLNYIKAEAFLFINDIVKMYSDDIPSISFSGGKDSTVMADLVIKALGNPSIVQIYSDTTLEFPETMDYIKRYRESNPKFIFKTAKNKDQDFFKVCGDIGVPTRKMRWCCTMFKTGPMAKLVSGISRDKDMINFLGVRKNESFARSKYKRIELNNSKLHKQKSIAPILNWKTVDIWLYILAEKLDFNYAYCTGNLRVGCYCCPNSGARNVILNQLYIPDLYNKWHSTLMKWAVDTGKYDADHFIESGNWKGRQGGNGSLAANDIKIVYTNCTSDENSRVYKLNKPIKEDFYNLFIPFGKVSHDLGRTLINETLVLDIKTNMPIISIQPMSNNEYEHSVKIKTMNIANHSMLERMISYQIRKYNACRRCLKCEGVCVFGAISVTNAGYEVNEDKCIRCKKCVSNKHIEGGCVMNRYLHTTTQNVHK